jgi:histidine ammonia-lyase
LSFYARLSGGSATQDDRQRQSNSESGTRDVYATIREKVPFIERDEYLKDHIDAVTEVVRRFEVK